MQKSFATILNRITFITRLVMNDDNLTQEDIDYKWRDSLLCDGTPLHIRTLRRDRDKIYELFGIELNARRVEGRYCYYIKNKEKLEKDGFLKWHISMLSMMEVIAGYKSLKDRIVLETYAPDPNLLPTILQAMENSTKLSISYRKFNGDVTKIHSIDPYFIKDDQHRLYLVGKLSSRHNRICVFSLDRIQDISPLDAKFKMSKNINAEDFFEDCFGVMKADDVKTVLITIRAYGDEMYYINSKPIHHSQSTIGNLDLDQGYCDFELYMKPTNDFIGYILSRSNRVEVLRPQWLRKQILATIQNMSNRYTELDH